MHYDAFNFLKNKGLSETIFKNYFSIFCFMKIKKWFVWLFLEIIFKHSFKKYDLEKKDLNVLVMLWTAILWCHRSIWYYKTYNIILFNFKPKK